MKPVTPPVNSSEWLSVNPTESAEVNFASVPPTNVSGDNKNLLSFEVMNLFLNEFIEKIVEHSNKAILERKKP